MVDSGHGGARIGAGRKPKAEGEKKKRITLAIYPTDKEELKKRGIKLQGLFDEAVAKALK